MKKIFTLSLTIVFTLTINAQVPSIEWQKSFGGSSYDLAWSVIQTTDGGYVVAGYSFSNNGDVTGHHGNNDYWIVKLSNTGAIQWQKSLGGSNTEEAWSIIQTTDGGYAIAGGSASSDGNVTGHLNARDYWVVKLNSTGTIQWQKILGGSGNDIAASIIQTIDGGYAIAGRSVSNDVDVSGNHGVDDFWVVKLNSIGTIEWQKSLGGSSFDLAYSIIQTIDSGYVVAGSSQSNDGDVSGNHGSDDYWIVKLSNAGIIEWQKSFGGSGTDMAYSIVQTTDGGYAVAGLTGSNDGNVTGNHVVGEYWVIKLTITGTIEWQKCLGGNGSDYASSIIQTSDGGYAIAGRSESDDGDVTGNHGSGDYWIVKLNNTGNLEWQKSLGDSSYDQANSIIQTIDGGYMVVGYSESNDGDVSGNHGDKDYWVVKLSASTGIEETENNNDFNVYPNPATNQLIIEIRGIEVEEINIYNTTGTLVSQPKQLQNKSIDISLFPKGIYVAEIKTKKESLKRRWIKM